MKTVKALFISMTILVSCLSVWSKTQVENQANVSNLRQTCNLPEDSNSTITFNLPYSKYIGRYREYLETSIDWKKNTFKVKLYNKTAGFKTNNESFSLDFNNNTYKDFYQDNQKKLKLDVEKHHESILKRLNIFNSILYFVARRLSAENEENNINNKNSTPLKVLSCFVDTINLAKARMANKSDSYNKNTTSNFNLIKERYLNEDSESSLAPICSEIKQGQQVKLKSNTVSIFPKTGLIIVGNSFSIDSDMCSLRRRSRPSQLGVFGGQEIRTNSFSCSSDKFSFEAKQKIVFMEKIRAELNANNRSNSIENKVIACIEDSLNSMLSRNKDTSGSFQEIDLRSAQPDSSVVF